MFTQEQLHRFLADLRLGERGADILVGIASYTRLPVQAAPVAGADLARAIWTAPLVGALIGLIGALAFWLAWKMKVPPIPAAALAVVATLLVTGCMHEDGLADLADGFGGGDTRERKLEIMRDSRVGTYGAVALAMSLILRVSALAELAEMTRPSVVMWSLVAAHATGRAILPLVMRMLPPARDDGLSAEAGQPDGVRVIVACILGIVILLLGLGRRGGLIALVFVAIAMLLLAWLASRQIGGQTGDVLGTQEQVGECVVLVCAAATA